MESEKIEVRATDTDTVIKVSVYSKRVDRIEVMLGEGTHSVKCTLTPTPNGRAYSGSALGREIVYERSPEQVKIELDRLDPGAFKPGRR